MTVACAVEGEPASMEEGEVTIGSVRAGPIALSTPGLPGLAPSVAALGNDSLVAWHEFGADGNPRIAYSLISGGIPTPTRIVPDSLPGQLRVSVAATDSGYVVAYQANDNGMTVIRSVELGAAGEVVSGPETITAPGKSGNVVRVAAAGQQKAFAWIEPEGHAIALRGPIETVPPTRIGTQLQSSTVLNAPRVAIDHAGKVFVAYRDGGDTIDWEVFVVTRVPGGRFGAPVSISRSPGQLSDDVAVAMEPNGSLDVVWIEQDRGDPNIFDAFYAVRDASGRFSSPKRFGRQGAMMWLPSVTSGLRAAWNGGGTGIGPFYIAAASRPPAPLLPSVVGSQVSIAAASDGSVHVALVENTQPRRVVYTRVR
jgi:hypothetical protein